MSGSLCSAASDYYDDNEVARIASRLKDIAKYVPHPEEISIRKCDRRNYVHRGENKETAES